jgi:hypothetical protein
MAVHDLWLTLHTFQQKAINADVDSRGTEYKITEQVRKEKNLPMDA